MILELNGLHVLNKFNGGVFCKTSSGTNVYVINGDLLSADIISAVVIEENNFCIVAEIKETYQNEEALLSLADDDGLIRTDSIDEILDGYIIRINDKWLFPDFRIKRIIKYLSDNQDLWKCSKIALTKKRRTVSGAIMYGVRFGKAIEILQNSDLTRARLYCDKLQDFSEIGVVAEMLVSVYAENKELINIQIWQGVKGDCEVSYMHGLMNRESRQYEHFDFAVIDMDISDQVKLFSYNEKIKGNHRKKIFRIDGNIKEAHVFELSNLFFPLDHLIDEYFEIERV